MTGATTEIDVIVQMSEFLEEITKLIEDRNQEMPLSERVQPVKVWLQILQKKDYSMMNYLERGKTFRRRVIKYMSKAALLRGYFTLRHGSVSTVCPALFDENLALSKAGLIKFGVDINRFLVMLNDPDEAARKQQVTKAICCFYDGLPCHYEVMDPVEEKESEEEKEEDTRTSREVPEGTRGRQYRNK